MPALYTERYRQAVLLICGHCGEGQIEYVFRHDLPTSVMCAECSNRNAVAAGVALCEREQRWPWSHWRAKAWVMMTDAKKLMADPEFHGGGGLPPLTLT